MTVETKSPVIKERNQSSVLELPRLFVLPGEGTAPLSLGVTSPRPMARLSPVVIRMLEVAGEIKA